MNQQQENCTLLRTRLRRAGVDVTDVFWGAHASRVLAIAPSRSRTFASGGIAGGKCFYVMFRSVSVPTAVLSIHESINPLRNFSLVDTLLEKIWDPEIFRNFDPEIPQKNNGEAVFNPPPR
jgi:hypothetical protein